MKTKRYRLGLVLLFMLALLISACQGGGQDSEQEAVVEEAEVQEPATPETTEVEPAAVTYVATEYAYDGPESLEAGWTHITLDNQGELAHDFILVKLAEGKSIEDVMTALEAEGPPDWAEFYGGVSAGPSASASYYVELTPGNYVALSFGEAEDAPPDAAQGMIANLTIAEASSPAGDPLLPEADASVDLVDYAFGVQGTIDKGEQLLKVSNKGTEMHEIIAFRLNEGMTMEDFMTALESEMGGEGAASAEEPASDASSDSAPPEEPPFEQIGSTFLSPGISTLVNMEFAEPGTYVFICFLPSPKNEMQPHFAMGMIEEITVQ
jgi:uncharacterized cupredoxin-like copper-binding protein